jgi:hypothetical protein
MQEPPLAGMGPIVFDLANQIEGVSHARYSASLGYAPSCFSDARIKV